MAKRVITRGNTVFLNLTFFDEKGDVAIVTSAQVQFTYPGRLDFETETVDMTPAGVGGWKAEWDSSKARPDWVDYHAHAYAGGGVQYAQDGRFRITGSRASLDHDPLPQTGRVSSSAMTGGAMKDYGQ